MMGKQLLIAALFGALLAIAIPTGQAEGQVLGEWSQPYRLSTGQGKASEAALASDRYGYVHAFWSELLDDQSSMLYYARFDGGSWSAPLDIYRGPPFVPIQSLSPFVDRYGTLHLAWSGGEGGPVFYMQAPAASTLSAQNWQEPLRIDLLAKQVRMMIDEAGVVHLLYSRMSGQARGIYYARSQDQAANWSEPRWLDPDILSGHMPGSLEFKLDERGGLHALWFYTGLEVSGGDWVRYAHSLDGGDTWSLPFTVDRLIEGSDYSLSAASPVLAVTGEEVHVVWAGGKFHYRNHRISTDSGQTWGPPVRIFGNLQGQAFESLTTDGLGRVHYLGQIRDPMAIYHAVWHEGRWSRPEPVYLISLGSWDPAGDRVHAHYTIGSVRAGNQLILTFTDSPPEPDRRLFAVSRDLEGVAAATAVPTPPATPTVEVPATPTPGAATTTATPPPGAALEAGATLPPATTRPDEAIWLGLLLPLLLMVSTIAFWLLNRYRQFAR
jgi:hypothetical protein